MIKRIIVPALVTVVAAVAVVSCTQKAATVGSLEPSTALIEEHIGYLADDQQRGRYVGTEGIARAEEYIASQYKRYGLEPIPGENDYFLEFDLYRSGFDPDSTSLQFETSGTSAILAPGVDFRPFAFSDEGEALLDVVFAGYGIRAPEYGYDDYQGLDVEGKAVLVLRHEPNEKDPDSPFDGEKHSKHAFFLTKAKLARELGAKAMILVTDTHHRSQNEDLRLMKNFGLEDELVQGEIVNDLLSVQVSQQSVDTLLAAGSATLEDLQAALDRGEQAVGLEIPEIRVSIRLNRFSDPKPIKARNTAAYLPARGDGRNGDWIVVGAHHDHIGAYDGEGDTIFNGADDNASGTAAVIELARMFSQCGSCNERPMVFMTFSAEEVGLFGSRAVFRHSLLGDTAIGLMMNLDMVGRNFGEEVEVVGLRAQPSYRSALSDLAEETDVDISYSKENSASSDHHPFHEAGIPAVFLFTGFHDDYHGLDDEADRIESERIAQIVTLAFRFLDTLFEEVPGSQ